MRVGSPPSVIFPRLSPLISFILLPITTLLSSLDYLRRPSLLHPPFSLLPSPSFSLNVPSSSLLRSTIIFDSRSFSLKCSQSIYDRVITMFPPPIVLSSSLFWSRKGCYSRSVTIKGSSSIQASVWVVYGLYVQSTFIGKLLLLDSENQGLPSTDYCCDLGEILSSLFSLPPSPFVWLIKCFVGSSPLIADRLSAGFVSSCINYWISSNGFGEASLVNYFHWRYVHCCDVITMVLSSLDSLTFRTWFCYDYVSGSKLTSSFTFHAPNYSLTFKTTNIYVGFPTFYGLMYGTISMNKYCVINFGFGCWICLCYFKVHLMNKAFRQKWLNLFQLLHRGPYGILYVNILRGHSAITYGALTKCIVCADFFIRFTRHFNLINDDNDSIWPLRRVSFAQLQGFQQTHIWLKYVIITFTK